MVKHKIAFFDIDGTLVDPKRWEKTQNILESIPESTRIAIKRLKSKDIRPAIATGRPKKSILELADFLEIKDLITSNGQEVVMQNKRVFQHFICQDVIHYLHQFTKYSNAEILYDTKEGILTTKKNLEADRILTENEQPRNVMQVLINTDQPIEKVFPNHSEVKVVKSGAYYYDVLPKNASKGTGIDRFLKKVNIVPEQTIAFGDEENDLEMFEFVGTSVAMGNATKRLKEKADQVTKEVWNDGIFYACEKLRLF